SIVEGAFDLERFRWAWTASERAKKSVQFVKSVAVFPGSILSPGPARDQSVTKGPFGNKFTFLRERRAGRCEAPRRRRCRTSLRIPSFARDAPLRAAARRPAGFVARSSLTAPGIARRSRLASPALRDSKM